VADIVALFVKIKKWFEDEGRAILSTPPTSPVSENMVLSPIRKRISTILDVLRDVIFPRIKPAHRIANEAVALVSEMAAFGAATHPICPAMLKYRPADIDAVATALERGLISFDDHEYLQAVRGMLFWLRAQGKGIDQLYGYDLPPVPKSLVTQFVCNFASRRQPGLSITLNGMNTLLSACPGADSPDVIRMIQLGLEAIHPESAYRIHPDEGGPIPFDQVPRYRCLIAELVGRLVSILPTVPASILEMKREFENDPLPEVRNSHAFDAELSD
jgi:hypothetical protein